MIRGQTDRIARILIVEDEAIIALNLRESLESIGYQVSGVVTSGEDAIQHCLTQAPDVVLMDIRLSGQIDGVQAATQIWDEMQIPVIFVTGYSDSTTVERVLLTAPFGYLLKPIRERELYVAIESALQRSAREQWLGRILSSAGDGVVVADWQGQIQYLNPVAEALSGWSLPEALNQQVTEVIPLVDEVTGLPIDHPLIMALQQDQIFYLSQTTMLITRDRTVLPIGDSAAPIRDPAGAVVGGVQIFRDETQRRQAEEREQTLERAKRLEQQLFELEQIQRIKDDFLSFVSHELRTPLTNIKLAIRMVEIYLGQLNLSLDSTQLSTLQPLDQYISILKTECEKELDIVNDFLDLQRLRANSYELEISRIDLQSVFQSLLDRFHHRIQERQLNLTMELPFNPLIIESDLKGLNRILSELLTNACKYTPPTGEIHIEVKIQDDLTTDQQVLISVCNSGATIPEAELTQIFDPFYRVPQTDRWSQGGTGLGLALVKWLVRELQGAIRVRSESEEICFYLQFPINLAP